MEEIDAILKRLGLDYVDQLVVHRHPSVVPNTPAAPLEEGLEALHDVVKAGQGALYRRVLHVHVAICSDAHDLRA